MFEFGSMFLEKMLDILPLVLCGYRSGYLVSIPGGPSVLVYEAESLVSF